MTAGGEWTRGKQSLGKLWSLEERLDECRSAPADPTSKRGLHQSLRLVEAKNHAQKQSAENAQRSAPVPYVEYEKLWILKYGCDDVRGAGSSSGPWRASSPPWSTLSRPAPAGSSGRLRVATRRPRVPVGWCWRSRTGTGRQRQSAVPVAGALAPGVGERGGRPGGYLASPMALSVAMPIHPAVSATAYARRA